jgi:CRISPR-associated protein Cmr3
MKQLLLQPLDILFFRDGRPMMGANPGRGARVPMQHVISGALHNALYRAFPESGSLPGEHLHRTNGREDQRQERFGSLCSVGPFPVSECGEWHFPRPLDLGNRSTLPSMSPHLAVNSQECSSAAKLLQHPVVNHHPPSKEDTPGPWLSRAGWDLYLQQAEMEAGDNCFASHDAFYLMENAVGIGMNEETGAVEDGKIYSAEYMRLREKAHLGIFAGMDIKGTGEDGIDHLFKEENAITVGGQMRVCRVKKTQVENLPLPVGPEVQGIWVKWTLLTPAIFQSLSGQHSHPGGWLPTWVNPDNGRVELLDGPGAGKARRKGLTPGQPIQAKLVSSRIGAPEIITGWSDHPRKEDGQTRGSKSTLLAVPAGSVYYFEADNVDQAKKLAEALNWHGKETQNPKKFVNRRSGMLGAKGYGIGVCSEWQPYQKK